MKVLWLLNEMLPDLAVALGKPSPIGGGWLVALSRALRQEGTIRLGVASRVVGGNRFSISLGGIQHFTVPAPPKGFGLLRPTKQMLHRYQEIVDEFSPDVIHVHGTEWYGGMVTVHNRMGRPVIIALQGLIDYHRRHLLGQLGFMDIVMSRTVREWVLFSGLWKQRAQWNKRSAVEREIISGHRAFVGRTLWDRAHLRYMNPNSEYFHCHEMVQKEFFRREWLVSNANRHTIFSPSASYPLKGFHVLVKAVAILRREFPGIQVRVPLATFRGSSDRKGIFARMGGDGYSSYLDALIAKLDVGGNITPLGPLSSEQMAQEMLDAHVFVLSSFVENSPNTMAEALIVGVPCVVSLAGGVPSLIDDGHNALGFSPGDEVVLAEQIRRIFINSDLANQLSKAGRKTALSRYSPEPIVKRMTEIYRAIARGDRAGILETPLGEAF
jgi:glycosyltransferase involved in cell wall biosynthesis